MYSHIMDVALRSLEGSWKNRNKRDKTDQNQSLFESYFCDKLGRKTQTNKKARIMPENTEI